MNSNLQFLHPLQLRHLLTLENCSRELIEGLLHSAQSFLAPLGYHCDNRLQYYSVANLFIEASTRTRVSFELAAKNLNAHVINFDTAHTSLQKGETLNDMLLTLQAMGINAVVLRHYEDYSVNQLAQACPGLSLINAGDGCHAHPSQALLDLLTIRQRKLHFYGLNIAIVGDILHSRVARSLVQGLRIMGVNSIRLVGPASFLPPLTEPGTTTSTQLDAALADIDVIVALRIQKERLQNAEIPDSQEYFQQYGITPERLRLAKPDVLVMHPGPMNREVDIASTVADGPHSAILQQVRNGVAVRMAILDHLSYAQ